MNSVEQASIQTVRNFLFDQYMESTHTCGKECQSLLLHTYKHMCLLESQLLVRERKEEYDKARYAKKKAFTQKRRG